MVQGIWIGLVLFSSFLLAGEKPWTFNSDSDSLYGLVRVHSPLPRERNPSRRLQNELDAILNGLTSESSSDYEEVRDNVLVIKQLLTNDILRELYDIFLDGVVHSSIKTIKSATSADGLTLKYRNAGLIHLKLFQGYLGEINSISDFSPAGPEDHFTYLDNYLKRQGVGGFMPYAKKREFGFNLENNKGLFAEWGRVWALGKSARRLAIPCATLLVGIGIGMVVQKPSPVERLDTSPPSAASESNTAMDVQRRADEAATSRGETAAEKLLSPAGSGLLP
jgi:hypothetical protein